MSNDPTNATIAEWRDLTPELAIVRVKPDAGQVPKFRPGQFITLGLPADPANPAPPSAEGVRQRIRLTRRSYSIASSALRLDDAEFAIVHVPPGKLTPRLWGLRQGGRVFMDSLAAGEFTLDHVPPDRDLVMLATGTGVAPYVSMLRTWRDDPRALPRWRRFVLAHGVRAAGDLAFRTELESIAGADRSVVYVPMVSRDAAWPGRRGRVTALLDPAELRAAADIDLDPATCHVFLCGNPAMIDEACATLESRGFVTHDRLHAGNLHFERYW